MSDATRGAIDTAAANAEGKCWAKAEELDSWYVEQFKEMGMNVATLNDEMQAKFEAVGAELKEAWLERAGDRGKAILDAYAGN